MSELRETARRAAAALGAAGHGPRSAVEALGEVGLTGVPLPAGLGGLGLGLADHATVVEEVARADGAAGAALVAHVGAAAAIAAHGSPEQRERLVPPLAQGHELASLAVDEGRTGLEADAITTWVDPVGRLTGTKRPSLRDAGVLVVLVREGDEPSAFVVRRGASGPRAAGDSVVFEATPAERLGRPGAGRRIALRALDRQRIATAALATGVAAAALAGAAAPPADGEARVAAARALVARAAQVADLGLPHSVEGATAERLAIALARELAAGAGRPDLLAALPE